LFVVASIYKVYNPRMDAREAKDFLVLKAAEQAQLEGVALSDLEKRMMYFTESDASSCDDPLALNDEFEAQYETPKYETKISELLGHAYRRLKRDDPQGARLWDQAIRCLRKGDHYILVMWDSRPIRGGFSKIELVSFLIVIVTFTAIWLAYAYTPEWLRSWVDKVRGMKPSPWVHRSLFGLLVAVYLFFFVSRDATAWLAKVLAKLKGVRRASE
jgi:hypothetical protein